MTTIKINFVDFWPGFDYEDFFLYNFIKKFYDVYIVEKPDYLICSSFGYSHWKYRDCIKIYYTAENLVPDFNIYDYGIGFHHLVLDDRYLRFPLWLVYGWSYFSKLENKLDFLRPDMVDRSFCNFVYSNGGWADPYRDFIFHELSKYKKVDSGGRHLNNIGFCVPDKFAFVEKYKFTIAVENSVVPGYTTEKIIEPMIVNSIPIYYGDPTVSNDFNMNSCVHLRDFSALSEAIEYIVYLDQDNEAYYKKLMKCWFNSVGVKELYERRLLVFIQYIFNAPYEEARRITNYGFARRYRKELSRVTPIATNFLFEKLCGLKDRLLK